MSALRRHGIPDFLETMNQLEELSSDLIHPITLGECKPALIGNARAGNVIAGIAAAIEAALEAAWQLPRSAG